MSFSITVTNYQYEIAREKLHATLYSVRMYYTIPICFRFESAFRKKIRFESRYTIGPLKKLLSMFEQFCYLASVIIKDGGAESGVSSRINKERHAFDKLKRNATSASKSSYAFLTTVSNVYYFM